MLVDNSDAQFTGHAAPVFTVSLHPAGELAVSGGEDDCAFVWRTSDGGLVHTLEKHHDSVVCTGFNRDGSLVATGSMDGVIKVYKVCVCVGVGVGVWGVVVVCDCAFVRGL
jgi:WD40 repeat protein